MAIKLGVFITVFATPLLGASGSLGYEQIKVAFFILSISLIGFLWMGKGLKWSKASLAAGLFIAFLLISSLKGEDALKSILGSQPYLQGWILYAYLFLFFLMVKTTKNTLASWSVVLTISAILVSLISIRDWVLLNILNQQIPNYAGRVVSTFGQPNFYAGFLLMSLPFAYFLFKNPDKRLSYFGLSGGMLSLMGIIVSYSRSAIFLALILIILALIDQLKIKRKMLMAAFAIIASSIVISLYFSSGPAGEQISGALRTNNPDLARQSVEKRIYIWPLFWQIAIQKPILGVGLENIDKAFADYFEKNKHAIFEENLKINPILISLKDLNFDRTHNYLLDLLLFSGILGLIFWVVLVILLLRSAKNKIILTGLILYLIWVQFQNQSVVHLIYFWLLAGLVNQQKSY